MISQETSNTIFFGGTVWSKKDPLLMSQKKQPLTEAREGFKGQVHSLKGKGCLWKTQVKKHNGNIPVRHIPLAAKWSSKKKKMLGLPSTENVEARTLEKIRGADFACKK